MRWFDRILLGVLSAGVWTAIALYTLSPQPVAAEHEPPYPTSSGDLVDFIWFIVEADCMAVGDGEIICDDY